MSIPHGLAGKAYVGTLYALAISASLGVMYVIAFGQFWIVVMIGAVMAVGFFGFNVGLAFRRQNYGGGG